MSSAPHGIQAVIFTLEYPAIHMAKWIGSTTDCRGMACRIHAGLYIDVHSKLGSAANGRPMFYIYPGLTAKTYISTRRMSI